MTRQYNSEAEARVNWQKKAEEEKLKLNAMTD